MELIVDSPIFAQKACELVNLASQFEEDIMITAKNRTVNAKSLLGVLSLGLVPGERIALSASSPALNAFCQSLKQHQVIQSYL